MNMDFKQALETALEMEKKGYQIYTETAEKTSNPHVKKTFSYLADQEVHHIREIEDYVETGKPPESLAGDEPDDVEDFFNQSVGEFKQEAELADDDIQAYEVALDLEKKGYDFYQQQYEKTGEEAERDFFKFLMEQENSHYELFSKDLDFLKNPEDFFADEEQQFYEGG